MQSRRALFLTNIKKRRKELTLCVEDSIGWNKCGKTW